MPSISSAPPFVAPLLLSIFDHRIFWWMVPEVGGDDGGGAGSETTDKIRKKWEVGGGRFEIKKNTTLWTHGGWCLDKNTHVADGG